jgi:hypothetical protein
MENRYKGSLIDQRLSILHQDGGYISTYILNDQGYALGGELKDYDADKMAELIRIVKSFSEVSAPKLNLGDIDEVSFVEDDKVRYALRPFKVGKATTQLLILVVVMMINQPYRMLTDKAVVSFRKLWEQTYG